MPAQRLRSEIVKHHDARKIMGKLPVVARFEGSGECGSTA